jgi:hypothetical protein
MVIDHHFPFFPRNFLGGMQKHYKKDKGEDQERRFPNQLQVNGTSTHFIQVYPEYQHHCASIVNGIRGMKEATCYFLLIRYSMAAFSSPFAQNSRVLIIILKTTLKDRLQAHNLSSSMLSGVESTRNGI